MVTKRAVRFYTVSWSEIHDERSNLQVKQEKQHLIAMASNLIAMASNLIAMVVLTKP